MNLFEALKKSWKRPEVVALLSVLGLLAFVLALGIIRLPVFLAVAIVILYLGTAFVSIYGQIRLIGSQTESRMSSHELQLVIDNMKEGVVIYTPDFKVLNINPAAEEIFDVDKNSVVGKKLSPSSVKEGGLKSLTQAIFPSLAPVVQQVSESGWPQIHKVKLNDPSLHLTIVSARILSQNGDATTFVKIIQDKTREKELLDSKTEFITTSAHQLRTPINAMSWAFESLRDDLEDKPDLKEVAEEGLDLTTRSLKIINDLLNVTQMEEGKYGLQIEEVGAKSLIQKVADEAESLAKEYDIQLNSHLPDKDIQIKVDPGRLKVALSTLIDNAITYNTERGKVDVSLKDKNEKFAQIEVSDTGIGIPEEDMESLFEKFHRGEEAAQIQPNGSGLGLYIVKNIINKHGGEVWANSEVNRGSTFSFTVPKA